MRLNNLLAVITAAFVSATAPEAFAQTSAQNAAAAQVLFDEGMKLMNSGQFVAACPKLKSAQNLDPGMATQFRLAECYEKLGATASAWALYLEVAEAARAAKIPTREGFARKRAKALEPRLSRMTITVAPDARDLAGLTIKRDGTPVERAAWGTAIPVDPGEHVIVAVAPGKKAWEGKGVVGGQRTALEITIPALEDAPTPPKVSLEVLPPPPAPERRSPVPAFIAGGAAIAAVGVGVGLYFLADGKRDAALNSGVAKGACVGSVQDPRCDELDGNATAVDTFHNIAIGTFVGAGVVAAGALTYLLWPNSKAKVSSMTKLQATPLLGAGQGGLVVSGSF